MNVCAWHGWSVLFYNGLFEALGLPLYLLWFGACSGLSLFVVQGSLRAPSLHYYSACIPIPKLVSLSLFNVNIEEENLEL